MTPSQQVARISNRATTTKQVHDITEAKPIPHGSLVSVEDYDQCAGVEFVPSNIPKS